MIDRWYPVDAHILIERDCITWLLKGNDRRGSVATPVGLEGRMRCVVPGHHGIDRSPSVLMIRGGEERVHGPDRVILGQIMRAGQAGRMAAARGTFLKHHQLGM